MPGQQPDPEFKAFFAGDWRTLHEAVEIPGMRYASWDRKAAYLLWVLGSHYARDTGLDDWQAVLMGHIVPDDTAPPQRTVSLAEAAGVAPFDDKWLGDGPSAIVGIAVVNPDEIDACPDYPEGVISGFDSAKW